MPQIGELQIGRDIGRDNRPTQTFIWSSCIKCGKERWVGYRLKTKRILSLICKECSQKSTGKILKTLNYKGGRQIHNPSGAMMILLKPSDFFFPMATRTSGRKALNYNASRYVFEHRLVMAKSLGRCLHSWEIVHHKNGIKIDNRIENLELTTNGSHSIMHSKGYRDGLQRGFEDGKNRKIQELNDTIEKLKKENVELRNVNRI